MPELDRPSTDLPLFVIPHPLGFEIGPQTIRKLSPPFVSAVARLSDLVHSFRRGKTLSPSGHLDCSMNLRSPHIAVGLLPTARRDSRHAVQANRTPACMISAFDWRRMVRHARTSRQLRPWIPVPGEPGSVPAEPPSSISDVFPVYPGRLRFD